MLENLHNYFVLFHFIDIILPEVISMNSNDFYQLAAELNVMDFTKSKPNYAVKPQTLPIIKSNKTAN